MNNIALFDDSTLKVAGSPSDSSCDIDAVHFFIQKVFIKVYYNDAAPLPFCSHKSGSNAF